MLFDRHGSVGVMRIFLLSCLLLASLAGCVDDDASTSETPADDVPVPVPEPHVIVGVPDSGINPYHQLYYREDRVLHPSATIAGFPEDVQALNLTVGPAWNMTWEERFEKDRALWDAIEPDTAYWIPQTVFVAVMGEGPCDGICILDDTGMHGTGTTSSVITENPDALIAFKEGGSGIGPLLQAGIPIDISSVSWGYIVPIPVKAEGLLDNQLSPIYVKAAGNDPRPGHSDSWTGDPRVISVGGAYAEGTEEALATKQPDIVSYYCRPTAQTNAVTEMRASYCGTSFAAPTAAGALSKVVLALREASGYTGTLDGDFVDPVLGVTVHDLREALNRTASYSPENQYPNERDTAVPVNPVAPWLQWGWGFYDGLVANATIEHLLGEPQPAKPMEAQLYMEALYTGRELLHG